MEKGHTMNPPCSRKDMCDNTICVHRVEHKKTVSCEEWCDAKQPNKYCILYCDIKEKNK
jgi:hypothetical protein